MCTENCDPNASCVEVEGGYECQCDEGFTGNGFNCEAEGKYNALRPFSASHTLFILPGVCFACTMPLN